MKESYSDSSIAFWERYNHLEDLPVLAFYSDSFPHERQTIGKKYRNYLIPNSAYHNLQDTTIGMILVIAVQFGYSIIFSNGKTICLDIEITKKKNI